MVARHRSPDGSVESGTVVDQATRRVEPELVDATSTRPETIAELGVAGGE